jgi:thiol-disulfide isomerase/thioredoxin
MTIKGESNSAIISFQKLLLLIVMVIWLSVIALTTVANAKPLANSGVPLKLQKMLTEKAFNKGSFAALKKHYKGQRWLLVLWSVDCPPCFKELAMIQSLSTEVAKLPIVIVNADASDDIRLERRNIIKRFELSHLTHLYFLEGQAAKSRYLIDTSWYGELPRSYFIDAAGKFNGKSGLITKQALNSWLIKSE